MTMPSDPKEALERLTRAARPHPADSPLTTVAVSAADLLALIAKQEGLEREVAQWREGNEQLRRINASYAITIEEARAKLAALTAACKPFESAYQTGVAAGCPPVALIGADDFQRLHDALALLHPTVPVETTPKAAQAPMPTTLSMPEYRYQQEDLTGGSVVSSAPPSRGTEDGEPALSEATIAELRRISAEDHARRHPDVSGLIEALTPFAAVADEYDDREDDRFEVWKDAGPVRSIRATFRLGLYRAARQALAAFQSRQEEG